MPRQETEGIPTCTKRAPESSPVSETWRHTIGFNERKLRHISTGIRNSFFPRFDAPFKVKMGKQIVEMVINVYGRMKPRFAIWSAIKMLDQLKIGDTVVFLRRIDGTYEMNVKRRMTLV